MFERGRSVETVILVQQDRTAHLEREYMQLIGAGTVAKLCWRTMRVWVYMMWHREHGMGHTWAPQESPAARARRYGLAWLGGVRGKRRGGARNSGEIFLENCGTDVIESSGDVV